ncbi:Rho GTPase-activating protein 17 [Nibea albiflora]|uniref:Rho GTPase-activating protein 17 n=1 Tax=Nibea albiflora TaxID=240163 RepID=A0ACB7F3R6_NIBAL|nr:Rho GTPase-activating protein 17 [Nibea albiflora]
MKLMNRCTLQRLILFLHVSSYPQIERRMELVRVVSHNTHKRMVSCLQGHIGADAEKRHKKLPLTSLSQAMVEGGNQLGEDSLIGKMMEVCGDAENRLASELMLHELQIEKDVLDPLSQLAEVDIPNILKQRKQLAKLVLDYDSARARLVDREARIWHRAGRTPEEEREGDRPADRGLCHDASRDRHEGRGSIQNRSRGIQAKEAKGSVGLFHVATGGVLLRPPRCRGVSDPDKRLQALWVVCDKLPKNNKTNLRYLVKFLSKLAQDSEANKMTPSNIAIVLGPNLMWAKTEGTLAEMAAATSVHVVAIVEPIIQHADWFFPEDVEFNVSGMFAMPTPASNHNNHLDYDCATIERKRPVSMVGPDNDTTRKDNTPNKHSDHTLRRGSNTLGRKQHTSPAFQPPLPPVEAPGQGHGAGQVPQPTAEPQAQPQPQPQPQAPSGGSGTDTSQHSLAQNLAALAAAQQLLAQHTEELSNPKLRDSTPAQTPLLQRNGSAGGGQAAGQLGTGTPGAGSMGPSPHMMRKGTKKQAPAPPKPTNPPPSQPCNSVNHTSSSGSSQSLSPTPRPLSSHSPTSPTSPTSQPCATPRRHSSNQAPIQAPSHPPPEPPTQASPPPQQASLSQSGGDLSPPGTPTPPDTPPPSNNTQDAVAPPSPSPYQSGSLPRPRPVPKPRNRPNVPPPPQPTTPASDTNGICATAYKMMDPAMSFKGLSRALVPELAVDQQPATASSSSSFLPPPRDCDLDTESTVL